MEDNWFRRNSQNSERNQEQSIADDTDAGSSQPMRAQPDVYSDRRTGNVDVEAYGGTSPNYGYEKTSQRDKRLPNLPKTQFSGSFASFHVAPVSTSPKQPEKQYSWIEEINNTAKDENLEDPIDDNEEESFFSKVLEYFVPSSHFDENKFTEEPHSGREEDFRRQPDTAPRTHFNQTSGNQRDTELRNKMKDNVDRQPQVEVEPSEDAYDESQANFSNKIDNTSLGSQEVQRQPEHRNHESQQSSTKSIECNPSDERYDDNQRSNLLDDNSRRQSWSANQIQAAATALLGTSIRQQHASFGTLSYQHPGQSSPNWAAGMGHMAAQPDADRSILESRAYKRQRQGSRDATDVAAPSDYLSRPPMAPSALALEALNNPSAQSDWLSDDDMGLNQLYEQQREAAQQSSFGYATGPLDKGIDSKPAISAANRTHQSDQRPKETSALPKMTEGPFTCLPVIDASQNTLGICPLSIYPTQDLSGDFDAAPASKPRLHQSIQRPMNRDTRREASMDNGVPPELSRPDSWSAYMATNQLDEGSEELKAYESPGSKSVEHPRNRSSSATASPREDSMDLRAALENFRKRKRYSRQENRFKDWADGLSNGEFESLYPSSFEEKWASSAEKSMDHQDSSDSVDIPTWTSSTSYGILAPFDAQPVSMDKGARETSIPTQDHSASNLDASVESGQVNRSWPGAAVPVPPQDPYFENPLHDMIGVMAAGAGAVAGTAVGAMTYLFGDHSSSSHPPAPRLTEQIEPIKAQKESSVKEGFGANMKVSASDQKFNNEQHPRSTQTVSISDGHFVSAEDQLLAAKEQTPGLSLGHVDDDKPALLLQPNHSRSGGQHTQEANLGATAIDQQIYNSQQPLPSKPSNVAEDKVATAGDQLVAAKEQNLSLVNHPTDGDEAAVLLHPQLSQVTEQPISSHSQPISSSMNDKTLQYEGGEAGGLNQQRDNEMVEEALPAAAAAVGIGALASGQLQQNLEVNQSKVKANEAENRELEQLFDPDPDTVRQPYHPSQGQKSSLDNRRQIWEANLSSALSQAATALSIQPRTKEEKKTYENYHVVDGPYKPAEHELGHNQFDSDFENWKRTSPSETPAEQVFENQQAESKQDNNVAIANVPSNDMSQNHDQQFGGGSFTSDAAWERVSFHDPSDYMKNTSSLDQEAQTNMQQQQQHSSTKKSKNPAAWLRRKLGKKHDNESI
ncbi:hypothetical protein INT43_004968 [Umbelopsis isabellina]|uniref:Uncharacterized protein n=1 Tax=Mortierella isabellina TaxID=91625 RepID=A0A8H7PFL9_MORIS|nr:hypothetical protein INT43_004968 [Umbelopsis isabellina]